MSTFAWQPLTDDDLDALRHLARRCLAVDGGLPQLGHEDTLRRLFLSGRSIGGRDDTGEIIAAASVFVDGAGHRTATGLVHPSMRGQGLGPELVRWAREQSGGTLLKVVAETTSPQSDAFFAELGLRRTFAEHIMRHDLDQVPKVKRPPELTVAHWDDDTAGLFHTAYRRSFADRPGFPDPPRDAWVAEVAGSAASARSCRGSSSTPTASGRVRDAHRGLDRPGRRRAVVAGPRPRFPPRRPLAAGARQGGLRPGVAGRQRRQPAHELYLRLGFEDHGLRARYEETHR